MAAIAIESIASAASFDTTFECYDGDTAKVSTLVSYVQDVARDTLLPCTYLPTCAVPRSSTR